MTVSGLPLHVLVIHAVVVLVPLTVLATILLAVLPRWRWLLRWPTAAAAVVCVPLSYLATSSGESLEHSRPGLDRLVREHSQHGEMLANLTVVLAVVVLAAAFLLPGPSALADEKGAVPSRWHLVDRVLPVLLVLAAAVVLVEVFLTGESGARAVWG